MTKKDYIKFADLFIKLVNDKQWNGMNGATEQQVLQGFMHIFKEDNSRFDSENFLSYINEATIKHEKSLGIPQKAEDMTK